ncbi:von Willebrand factor type A domain-containing protein [Mycena galericulata]|nr:von Willebrand factor type A domain-containing protein [Mycena galericulata]
MSFQAIEPIYGSITITRASIKELAAQVKLTQTNSNTATFPIEGRYFFPIPARAAEARETYNAAVAQGQQASLMEQQTPDVGNIPSNEQVQIELVYATELAEDEESDSIRFHLPVHIGARFGSAPQSAPTPFRSRRSHRAHLKIGCPSHTVSTELGPDPKLPNFKELPFSKYARVSLSSNSALDKDFVLTIKAAGLDAPCCIAELHPTHETVALGLTLVPRFKLPDLSRQEFVFLVDRSGSMRGERIDAAKKALVVMLRALPHQESLFQIVSFDDYPSFLWNGGSQPYDQQTLEEATRHVDGMRADYGGTQIWRALQECFEKRRLDRPMSVLVLTDGDAWDLDGVLNAVKSAGASAPATAYVRVSVLGIGNSASTAMCEGIARLGNGTCMMVGEEEETRVSFTGEKIVRILKAARTPPISNISVDWGRAPGKEYTSEKPEKTLNIFDEAPMETNSTPPPVVLPPSPAVQHAPSDPDPFPFPNICLTAKSSAAPPPAAPKSQIALPVPVSHLADTGPGFTTRTDLLQARTQSHDLVDAHARASSVPVGLDSGSGAGGGGIDIVAGAA